MFANCLTDADQIMFEMRHISTVMRTPCFAGDDENRFPPGEWHASTRESAQPVLFQVIICSDPTMLETGPDA